MEEKKVPTVKDKEEKKDVNVVRQKKGWRKHLDRFGHFLMMGGFIVVLIAIVAIVIAVSTCSAPK